MSRWYFRHGGTQGSLKSSAAKQLSAEVDQTVGMRIKGSDSVEILSVSETQIDYEQFSGKDVSTIIDQPSKKVFSESTPADAKISTEKQLKDSRKSNSTKAAPSSTDIGLAILFILLIIFILIGALIFLIVWIFVPAIVALRVALWGLLILIGLFLLWGGISAIIG